jgi:hypothetical protein
MGKIRVIDKNIFQDIMTAGSFSEISRRVETDCFGPTLRAAKGHAKRVVTRFLAQ